jgi:hypothetical protein
MELNLSDKVKQLIAAFILMIIPLLLILIGAISNYLNAWYYIGTITWFGIGLIFFINLKE